MDENIPRKNMFLTDKIARLHRKPFGLFCPLETCFFAEYFHPYNYLDQLILHKIISEQFRLIGFNQFRPIGLHLFRSMKVIKHRELISIIFCSIIEKIECSQIFTLLGFIFYLYF